MSVSWCQSFSGKKVTPLDLKPEQVDLESVAHHLALKCRFGGACREFYSVAEHCVRGSRLIAPSYRLAFLLHEVDEVYLDDIRRPIKPHLALTGLMLNELTISWSVLAGRHEQTILVALGHASLCPLVASPEVKAMDNAMLAWEARDLMGPSPEPWEGAVEPPPGVEILTPWPWQQAEREWLDLYAALVG
jgi:hypothetical protein